jgi:hypothetical protein
MQVLGLALVLQLRVIDPPELPSPIAEASV